MLTETYCKYKNEILKICYILLSRNRDISVNGVSDLDIENMPNFFDDSFLLFVSGRKIHLDYFTTISECRYIFDNIRNIEYIYCYNDRFDSVFGNILRSMMHEFCCKKYNNRLINIMYFYKKFIENCDKVPDKNSIILYIERNINDETKDI